MSTSAPANVNATATATGTVGKPVLPPEEQFWQRYSPHSEAPLSGVSSTVVHILIIMLILGVAWVQSFLKVDEEHRSAPVEPIRFDKGGGGGDPRAKGSGPGDIGDTLAKETDTPPDKEIPFTPDLPPLDVSKSPKIEQEFGNDAKRLIETPTTQFNSFAGLGDKARENLRKSVGGGGNKGQGGSGTGGGRDVGRGTGEGGGEGPGKGGLTKSEKRIIRWTLLFNTRDGRDYRDQLMGLGGIIAIPIDESKGTYQLIRDLRKPVPKEEDVSNLEGIFWIDDKPDSVNALFGALGVPAPARFVAFFPKEMEDLMLRQELAYTEKNYRTREEDRIHETKFRVVKDGNKYEVQVTDVKMKR